MHLFEVSNHKEVSLLGLLSKNPDASQRDLSTRLGVSLGQVNNLIKNLIDRRELEINRTNKRKVEYLVTDLGKARWLRYARSELANAFDCVSQVKKIVGTILDKLFAQGVRVFVLDGQNRTLAAIVSEVFRDCIGEEAKLLWGPAEDESAHIVLDLDTMNTSTPKQGVVNLLHEVMNAK